MKSDDLYAFGTSFKTELKELLAKYNVTISFSFDGDTYGIYDEKVVIYHEIKDSFRTIDLFEVNGSYIDKNSL